MTHLSVSLNARRSTESLSQINVFSVEYKLIIIIIIIFMIIVMSWRDSRTSKYVINRCVVM